MLPRSVLRKPHFPALWVAVMFAFAITSFARAATVTRVIAWGGNQYGETNVPPGLTNVVAIGAGEEHFSAALKADGTVVTWGDPGGGISVEPPPGLQGIKAIAVGHAHIVALRSNGTVVCWGAGGNGQTSPPIGLTNVIAVSGGGYFSLALRSDGTVAAWGENLHDVTLVPGGLNTATKISGGVYHALALKSDTTVVGWGDRSGTLYNYSGAAVPPGGLTGVTAIFGGYSDSVALLNDGTMVQWGSGGGPGVGGYSNVRTIARRAHMLVLFEDGTVYGTGNNNYGQATVPPGLSNVKAVAVSSTHSMVLMEEQSPTITVPPTNVVVTSGGPATFAVGATSTAPMKYQWFRDNAAIGGATNTALTFSNVHPGLAGTYFVVITNSLGSVTSPIASLTLISTAAPPAGLVGWWRAEGNAADTAGLNSGSLANGTSFASGIVGQAFRFDFAQSQYVLIPDSGSLRFSNRFTLEAWVNPASFPVGGGALFSKDGGVVENNSFQTALRPNSTLLQFIAPGETWPGNVLDAPTVIPTGAWTHVAWSYDAGWMRCYVNGALTGSLNVGPKVVAPGAANLRLSSDDSNNGFFDGLVDEAAAWNRALPAEEILAHYQAGSAGYLATRPFIASGPNNQTVGAGSNATFSVSLSGSLASGFQWLRNGQPLAGATNATLALTNAQPAHAGNYHVIASNSFGSITSQVAALTVEFKPAFTNRTSPGLASLVQTAFSVSAVDEDGDGDIDLFMPRRATVDGSNLMLRNDGGWQFVSVASNALVSTLGNFDGAAWVDYNNDGDLDVYLSNTALEADRLIRKEGSNYVNQSISGLTDVSASAYASAWADFDRDGWVDLAVANWEGLPPKLYRNTGNNQFVEVVGFPGASLGLANTINWVDWDGDGDSDLVFGDGTNLRLVRNDGQGTFVLVANNDLLALGTFVESPAWGDYDNDGDPDLYVAIYNAPDRLFRNDGGVLVPVSDPLIISTNGAHYAASWLDLDGDGYLDLVGARDGGGLFYWRNNGAGGFESRTVVGLETESRAGGVSVAADFDRDGFQDLLVVGGGVPARLYGAIPNGAAWLNVRVIGKISNRSGIGTKIRVQTLINGQTIRQSREITGGGGLGFQEPLEAHFGLSDATNIDLLRIEWPSGAVQEQRSISPRQFLTVTEPSPLFTPTSTRVIPGSTLRFAVSGSYPAGTVYQWRRDGTNLPSATNAQFVIANFQSNHLATYQLVISNATTYLVSPRWQPVLATEATDFVAVNDPALVAFGSVTGMAWGDYDNDGHPDLWLNSGNQTSPQLYRNLGGRFALSTSVPPESYTKSLWVDSDNDGDLDLFITGENGAKRLYRNDGGAFSSVTNWGGQFDVAYPLFATAADYDRDGRLDLFVATWNGEADLLYRNQGGNTFARVTTDPAGSIGGWSYLGAWADYDNDGWPDLFAANRGNNGSGGSLNFLFHNDGGSFSRVMSGAIANDQEYSTTASWADYDNDGDLDLFVGNDIGQVASLYRNDGVGGFARVTGEPAVAGGNSMSSAWGDFDNDGDVDLFVANYYNTYPANYFYRNEGSGTFTRLTTALPATQGGDSFCAAWVDYDGDGHLDLAVGNFGGPLFLYRNEGNNYGWLKVRCVGAATPTAIGAKVRILTTAHGTNDWQMRQVTAGSGYGTQEDLVQHFGLREATNVSQLRIEWPSGRATDLPNVAPNQLVTVVEPVELYVANLGGGTVSVTPQTNQYFVGQTLTLTASTNRYHRFVQWSDGNTNTVRNYTVGLSNVLTAIFTNTVPLEESPLKGWELSFGGTNGDMAIVVRETGDGGFLLGGYSTSAAGGSKSTPNYGGLDFWIVRLDATGRKLWEKNYGGTGDDELSSLEITTDGGFIVGGTTASDANGNKTSGRYGGTDFWVLRLDSSGEKLWERVYGGGDNDSLKVVRQTADGGFIFAGDSSSLPGGNKTAANFGLVDYWAVRTDRGGNVHWDRSFGGSHYDSLLNFILLRDGGIVFSGESSSEPGGSKTSPHYAGYDAWVLRLDANGNERWQASYGGGGHDYLYGLGETPGGDFLLAGASASTGGGYPEKTSPLYGPFSYPDPFAGDAWVVRLDAAGHRMWDSSAGGSEPDFARDQIPSDDGGHVLAGSSLSGADGNKASTNHGNWDGWIFKIDGAGGKQWELSLGGTNRDDLVSICRTGDGGYVAGGRSGSEPGGNKASPNFGQTDFWLLKVWERVAPVGTPVIFANLAYLPSNHIFNVQSPVSVTMTSSWNGPIHFTIDGTEPDFNSALYDPLNPPQVVPPATVKAIAYLDDLYLASELYVDYSEVVSTRLEHVPLYSLDLSTPGGGTVTASPAGGPYASNSVATIVATNSPGWTFLRWEGGVTGTNPVVAITMTSNVTAHAIFGTALTTNVTGLGSIAREPALALYPFGSNLRLTALPNAGRFLSTWGGALSGSISPQELTITNPNPSVSATFGTLAGPNFGLVVQVSGEGTVSYSPATNRFASNAVVTLTATPKPGWSFAGWTGSTNSALNPLSLVMNSTKTVTAKFLVPPAVTIVSPTNGQIVRTPNLTVTANATATASAIDRVEVFLDSVLAGTVTNAPYSLSLTNLAPGAHTLTAVAVDDQGVMATSSPVSISVEAIQVLIPPRNISTRSGVNAYLTVLAASTPAATLGYQWKRFGTNLPGETYTTLFLPGVRTTDAGTYQVELFTAQLTNSATAFVNVTATPPTRLTAWGRFGSSATNMAPSIQDIIDVSLTDGSLLALRQGGSVLRFGFGGEATPLAGIANLVGLDGGGAEGGNQGIGFTRSGSVLRWDGSGNQVFDVPAAATNVVGVAAGNRQFSALKRDGTVISWGEDIGGSTSVPAGLSNVVSISSGVADWTMALKNDGTVVGWGADGGWHTATMTSLSNLIAISAGGYHGLALHPDNSIVAWGDNGGGQTNLPTAATNIAAMEGGLTHSVAVRADGEVIVWGENASGATTMPPTVFGALDVAAAWGSTAALLGGGVSATNTPPTVTITNPVNDTIFTAPVNIAINASAADSDGSVTQVVFRVGLDLLGTAVVSPFSFTWNSAPVGTHVLTAVATHNGGLSTTSSPVTITVQTAAPEVALTSPSPGASFFGPTNIFLSALVSDADNSISNVTLHAGNLLLTTITVPPYSFTWSNVAVGNYTFTARVQDMFGPIVTSAPVNISVVAPNVPAVFRLAGAAVSTSENAGSVSVTVVNDGTLGGTVNYVCTDVTATGGSGSSGDYTRLQGLLTFTNGEPSKTLTITIRDDFLPEANETFEFRLSNPGGGASLTNPTTATITINDDDANYATNSWLAIAFPSAVPDTSGRLRVTLNPPAAGGQWRFPWELGWRNSGVLVTNLEVGNYEIEFRAVAGYEVIPSTLQVAVVGGPITEVTNEYFFTGAGGLGWLTVELEPNTVVSNAGWRLAGEVAWRAAGATATNLVTGVHVVEFKPVSGWSAPATRTVQVYADQGSGITGGYLLAEPLPGGVQLPLPINPFSVINDSLTFSPLLPYAFNGQLQTVQGFGSGVAVREKVVLTAAHVVFNDETLAFVGEVNWFFQKHAGDFEPRAQKARGWYVLSSYSGARSNDLAGGYYAPGQSSPQSRNWDVAALYFTGPAARGGYGGYLTSDAGTNEWLVSSRQKLLVGYPLDGAAFGHAGLSPGKMHATAALNYSFTAQTNRVYTTPGFLSFPGNSGGPVYVLNSNAYYPAGVYLGTLGNNQSLVRSIDSNVVALINLAANLGDEGTNNTGGGVLTIIPSATGGAGVGYLQVKLGPPAALAAGGGWRLAGDAVYSSNPNFTRTITNGGGFSIEFKPIAGWNVPASRSVTVPIGQVTAINADYTPATPTPPAAPQLVFSESGIGLTGVTGTTYRIEYRPSLSSGTWLPLRTNTLGAGFNLVIPWPPTNGPTAFYRAVWLP